MSTMDNKPKGVSKKNIKKTHVKSGVEGNRNHSELYTKEINSHVKRIIEDITPYLGSHSAVWFSRYPSNDVGFIHFLIFFIWFSRPFVSGFDMDLIDLYDIYSSYRTFPFHSFLFHIRR